MIPNAASDRRLNRSGPESITVIELSTDKLTDHVVQSQFSDELETI
jgi:hypothetical protein